MTKPSLSVNDAVTSPQAARTAIAVAHGDGIGPEIMNATLRILEAAGAQLETHPIEIGEQVYLQGHSSGIRPEAWEILRKTGVLLKAPITTPLGGGYKSLNVTLRKTLGLFANVRPTLALHPFVKTAHPKMDVVIVRENEEDLYAGIEHRQSQDVYQCIKVISRPGCEKIVRYAFEYARAYGRKKVTAMGKDNIMKLTDGLFHKVFQEIGREYPDIQQDYKIIDIGSALLAERPEQFDVIVTLNLYGDIISDIAAQISGSIGMAGSANVGSQFAMFEAIHGSAPDIAGKGIANPSGLLNSAISMLIHIGQTEVAERVQNAWLKTLEDGLHTGDIYQEGISSARVGTDAFADAVIARLGQKPQHLKAADLAGAGSKKIEIPAYVRQHQPKTLVGVDIFLNWEGESVELLGKALEEASGKRLKLKLITNRGVKVYPDGHPETFCTDHWRCRFVGVSAKTEGTAPEYTPIDFGDVVALLAMLNSDGLDVIKTENLYLFGGERGFSLGQGE